MGNQGSRSHLEAKGKHFLVLLRSWQLCPHQPWKYFLYHIKNLFLLKHAPYFTVNKTIHCELAARKPSLGTQYVSFSVIILIWFSWHWEKKEKRNSGDFTQISRPRKNSDFKAIISSLTFVIKRLKLLQSTASAWSWAATSEFSATKSCWAPSDPGVFHHRTKVFPLFT